MSSNTPVRLSRICPTLALLIGLGAAAVAADPVPSLTVVSTGQTQSGDLVKGGTSATFTVTFDQDVFPALYGKSQTLAATDTIATEDLYNAFVVNHTDKDGGAEALTTTVQQTNGRAFTVSVSGLEDDDDVTLSVIEGVPATPLGFIGAGVGGTKNAASAAGKKIRILNPANGTYWVGFGTDNNTGFVGKPALIGDFMVGTSLTVPKATYTAADMDDYLVKFSGAVTGEAVTTNGSWLFQPSADITPLGRYTITASPEDAAGNVAGNAAIKGGADPTLSFYIWTAPSITEIEQVDAAYVPYDTLTQKVSHTKPELKGKAGLPTNVGGGTVTVKVDIFNSTDVARTTPIITQVTPTLGADSGGEATWALSDANYSNALVSGQSYDVVVNMRVLGTNLSSNSITAVYPIEVNTADPNKPTLDADTTTGGTQATLATAKHRPTIGVSGDLTPTDDNVTMQISVDDGSSWNPITGVFTGANWKPTKPLQDGTYKFRATWVNDHGLGSKDGLGATEYSDAIDVVVTTPRPVLTPGANAVAGGAKDDGNVQYLDVNLKPLIAVAGPTAGTGDLRVFAVSRGGNGATSIQPYTIATGAGEAPDSPTLVNGPVTDLDCFTALTTAMAGANNDLVFTAKLGGAAGAPLSVRLVDPAANSATLSVSVSGYDITVNLATDGSGVITSTASQVSAAIADSTEANALVAVANAAANDGTGVVTALAQTTITNWVNGSFAAGVWTPADAFVADRYSLVAKWTDDVLANDTSDDSPNTDRNAVSQASLPYDLRVLPSVSAPVFTGINLANLVPNALPTNFIVTTSSGSIVLGGTGNPGATLKLKVGSVSLPHKTIGTDGTWTYEFSTDGDKDAAPLASGTNQLTATQLDLSGTESAATTKTLIVNVSGSLPQAPTISSPLNSAKVADTTPLLSGTAPANTTVSVYKATKQTITMGTEGIVLTARSPKAASIVVVDPGTPSAALTVGVVGTVITVNLATNGASAITTTAGQVLTAINGSAAAAALVRAALDTGDTGVGLAVAVASTPIAASSMVGEVSVTSSGKWSKELGTLKDGTTATTPATLAAGAEPGSLYTLFATATSASGIEGNSSGTIDLYVVTPAMSVALAAIAKGTGDDYTVSEIVAKAKTLIKVVSAANSGTILVGDTIRLVDNVTTAPTDIIDGATDYKVTAVTKTASGPDAYTLTISPGLKEGRGVGSAMSIQANPSGPTSGKSSLASILLTATFTNGGAVDEIATGDFTKDDFAVTNGTITSITKGTGLVGKQPTNVWTIAVAPSVTQDVNLTVQVKEATVPTKPGYILSGFEASNVGSNYTPAYTTLKVGGGSAASITWTDNGDGGGTAADGKIQAGELDIVDPGYGFTAAATSITVTGGPGSGAVVPTSIPFTTGAGFTTGVHALTTKGKNYINGVAKVAFIGGGTPSTPAAATATVTAGEVVSIDITTAGTGYTSRPTIVITSGSGAVIKGLTTAGTVVFNSASNTYTQAIDRIKPVVTWKGAADMSEQLYNVAVGGTPATGAVITGLNYANLVSPASDTQFKVRASFSSPMSRELVAGDLQVAGATVMSVTDLDGLVDDSAGDTNQEFDILLKRGSSAATAMTVTVKAMADLKDDAIPAQANVASPIFSAKVVGVPTAPTIASTVGALTPLNPARTGSYPCTVKFTAPVTGFTAQSLTVTNGVIAKFNGTGSTYNFTLVPGEGQVSVLYDSTLNPILDVAGNAIPSSNTLIRVLDSTQTLVSLVASPAFMKINPIKPQNGGAAYNKVAMQVTFSEAPKSFPSSAVFATLASNGSVIGMVAPAGSAVGATGPQVVGEGGKTYAFDLVIPATGSGSVNLVLPALLVPDQAGNQSAASEVYTIEYDHAAGTPVEMVVNPEFSNG